MRLAHGDVDEGTPEIRPLFNPVPWHDKPKWENGDNAPATVPGSAVYVITQKL
ncbi:MAG TPA: hypothetical protein VIK41_13890 [Gemmatimonadaceae bacterium]